MVGAGSAAGSATAAAADELDGAADVVLLAVSEGADAASRAERATGDGVAAVESADVTASEEADADVATPPSTAAAAEALTVGEVVSEAVLLGFSCAVAREPALGFTEDALRPVCATALALEAALSEPPADAPVSAWAMADPPAAATPIPRVTAPTPSHAWGRRRRRSTRRLALLPWRWLTAGRITDPYGLKAGNGRLSQPQIC